MIAEGESLCRSAANPIDLNRVQPRRAIMNHTASRRLRAALRSSVLLVLLAGALAIVPALSDASSRVQSGKLAPANTGAFSGTITDVNT